MIVSTALYAEVISKIKESLDSKRCDLSDRTKFTSEIVENTYALEKFNSMDYRLVMELIDILSKIDGKGDYRNVLTLSLSEIRIVTLEFLKNVKVNDEYSAIKR